MASAAIAPYIPIIAAGVGGLFQGLAASGQDRDPFTGAVAPQALMQTGRDQLLDAINAMKEFASRDITLPGAVTGMPTFAGGGLPMPIGMMNGGADLGAISQPATMKGLNFNLNRTTGTTSPPPRPDPTTADSGDVIPPGQSGAGGPGGPAGPTTPDTQRRPKAMRQSFLEPTTETGSNPDATGFLSGDEFGGGFDPSSFGTNSGMSGMSSMSGGPFGGTNGGNGDSLYAALSLLNHVTSGG